MTDVLVLGAGPAGLMAGLQAARAGLACTVLEAAPQVGGMAGSFVVADQRVDYGSHRLHPATPPRLLALIQDLLGPDLQVRPRSGRIAFDGRWLGFPLHAKDMVKNLAPSLTARLVADAAGTTVRSMRADHHSQDGMSFFDVVEERFGRTVAQRFYGPYATKLYGTDAKLLHPELAARRVSAASSADVARRVLRASRPQGRTFLYPRRGYGQIVEMVAEAAVEAGVTISVNAPVTAVTTSVDGVTVEAGDVQLQAPICLSTVPATALMKSVDPPPPESVRLAADQLRTRAMILVYLVLDQPQYTPFDAHYLPDPALSVARLSEPKNYRDGDDPAGRTVLCAEIACWRSDQIWSWSPEQLAALAVEDLVGAGLPPVRPVHCEVRRLPSVYPVYDLVTGPARQVVDEWLRLPGPVVTLGRQGLRVIDNLHHVMKMGSAAAESVGPGGTFDWQRWTEHLDVFAAHTVED